MNALYEEIERLKAEIEKLNKIIMARDLRILEILNRYKANEPLVYYGGDVRGYTEILK